MPTQLTPPHASGLCSVVTFLVRLYLTALFKMLTIAAALRIFKAFLPCCNFLSSYYLEICYIIYSLFVCPLPLELNL